MQHIVTSCIRRLKTNAEAIALLAHLLAHPQSLLLRHEALLKQLAANLLRNLACATLLLAAAPLGNF